MLAMPESTKWRWSFIASFSLLVALNAAMPPAHAGVFGFVGRHLFGSKKDKDKKKTAHLPKPTQSAHPTRPFSANASWYGGKFNGRRTASGEVFDENKLTAASRTLPLGSKVLVQNPATGKSCTVVINDRGPFVAGRDLDLSRAAAQRIGVTGVSPVVCTADTSGLPAGSTSSHNGGLLKVPGKVFHMIAGIM